MRFDEEPAGQPEFWREEAVAGRRELRRQAVRWGLVFALLVATLFFALWWSASAVHFGATRVEHTTPFQWKVSGTVRDAKTGAPVPWANVRDDPAGRPPLNSTMANHRGVFELLTVAEPHDVLVSALGYRTGRLRVGRPWYLWMPRGAEQVTVELEPEPKPSFPHD